MKNAYDKKEKVDKKDDKGGESGDSYIIPEDWQREVKTMLEGCNKKQLAYIRECIYEKEAEMRKDEFDTEGMPA